MKLDLKAIKVISIVMLKDIYHIVYLKNDDKHAMEIIKNGDVCNEAIKPLLINYANFLGLDITSEKTTYQIFDILYKEIYKK